jgi:AbrB family looped-hinge helix DNA binding protein
MESYISKVTSAGQLTLPKKIRKGLGLKGGEYVEVALLGKAVVIRRLQEEDEMLKVIRRKVRKSGLTRARVQELVDEARGAPASSKTLDDAES